MERRKTRHSLALVYLGPSPVEEKDTRTREDTDDADGASGGRKAGKGRDGKDPEKVCGVSMAYVERGVVKPKRSLWRLSTITHFFWAIVNFIGVFFITMFSKEKSDEYRKTSGSGKKWDGGPGGGPGGGRGPYDGGPRGPHGMADLRSNDHNALPACGSCCGG